MNGILSPSRVEAVLWIVLVVGLATGIGIETDWGKSWHWPIAEVTPAQDNFPEPVLPPKFTLSPPDIYLETTLRPIFVATRRPAPAAPPPEPPRPTMKRDQFTLTGITVLPDGKFAFLTEKTGNKSRVVAEGKEINGITVKEIRNDRVVLGQYDETEVLMLKTAKGPAATAQPALEKDASGSGGSANAIGNHPTSPAAAPPANTGNDAARAGTRPPRGGQSRAQPPAVQPPPTGSH